MISESTLRQLQDKIDVAEVIGKYIKLSKSGSGYVACCPLHDENTPSFHISAAKGIYKCYGCGKGGDAISFIREYKRLTFPEAVEDLCKMYGIHFETEQALTAEQYKEKIDEQKTIADLMNFAESWYHKALLDLPDGSVAWEQLYARGIDRSKAIAWRLGFAPDNSKNITDHVINKGWHKIGIQTGLIKTKSGITYDFYRNRIVIPIRDKNGNISGFSGRNVSKDEYAKYINPPESEVYSKSTMLFGLYEAQAAIKQFNYAYLVEGNFDVISMHLHGAENTVAPCGTALTPDQIKLLKRYTQHAVVIGDNDSAGIKAMSKQIDLLLQFDFRTEVVELPAGHDPDSFIRSVKSTYESLH